jgi:hypothetical protein
MLKSKINLLLYLFLLLGLNSEMFSQMTPTAKPNEQVDAIKKIRLLEILELNESESDKFLSKYTILEKTIKEKNDLYFNANKELMDYLDNNSGNKDLNVLSNNVILAQKEIHTAIENKYNSMKQLLSNNNYAKFIAFEFKFANKVRRMLTEQGDEFNKGNRNKPGKGNKFRKYNLTE